MSLAKNIERMTVAIAIATVCAMPLVAFPGASGKASPMRSKSHRHVVRERGVDPTIGDNAEYDDPMIRQAAVEAIGRYNGSIVAVDPNSGRILTVVNQKMAYSDGAIPCSTIKPTIAVAALDENLITSDTMLKVGRRKYMNLTEAMAHSNNEFFAELGRRLGFETVSRYARMMGIGELSGYDLQDEHPGALPSEPPAKGGVGRMSSFGEGIQITPFQLASMAAAFANGGTLYYLQYPKTAEERENFEPRVKRQLNIGPLLPDLREGMLATVLYGTGKRSFDAGGDELPAGKTGTCSDSKSRVGWFVSYADEAHPKIALAVLIRGNTSHIKGPLAAQVAGKMYRFLREQDYFANLPHRDGINSYSSGH
ncbi:MAG TPA: penicillin-binding transpeptidase domain-containing protein [Terriglobales bacterium]|nr:penicillin-binding transpeptidase domain-containing protein [Terriglobales bacterium]